MRLLRTFPVLAFVLVLLSIVGLTIALQSPGLLIVAGALAAISWYVTEGPRGWSPPKWVTNILVIAVALSAAVEFLPHREQSHIPEILGRFGLWLTIIKLYERRTARDYAHLLMLSFLLMLVASLQSADLIFGVILLLYVVLGLYVLLLFQLHASYERSKTHRRETTPIAALGTAGFRLLPPMKPIIGQQLGSHFRSLVAGVTVSGLALGMIAFLAFPRGVGSNIFGEMLRSSVAQPGFAENVNLVHGRRITDSRRPVMDVQLLDQRGEAYAHHEPLLLRGAALDHYDGGGKWRASSHSARERFEVNASEFQPLTSAALDSPRTITQVVRSYVDRHVLFTLQSPLSVKAERTQMVEYDLRNQIIIVPPRPEALAPSAYSVLIDPAPTDAMLEDLVVEEPIGNLEGLRLLRDDDIAELARARLRSAGFVAERPSVEDDPAGHWQWARDAAHVFKRYLHSEEYLYTLDLDFMLPVVEGAAVDPVRYFLLETKQGHCEYFASALAALCTNLGIESRLVVGYLASDYDSRSGKYHVRERNAHAWVEVRTGPRRWTAVDPTPPAAIERVTATQPTMGDRFRGMYDRVAASWSRSVIDFNWRSQQQLAQRLDVGISDRTVAAYNAVRRWMGTINVHLYLGRIGYVYMAFMGSVLAFGLYVLIFLMRKSAAIRKTARLEHAGSRLTSEYRQLLRDSGFYFDMLSVLRRGGHEKPAWLPPLAFATLVARTNPRAAELIRDLTRRFYQSRYGGRRLTQEEVAAARSTLATLAEEMREKTVG